MRTAPTAGSKSTYSTEGADPILSNFDYYVQERLKNIPKEFVEEEPGKIVAKEKDSLRDWNVWAVADIKVMMETENRMRWAAWEDAYKENLRKHKVKEKFVKIKGVDKDIWVTKKVSNRVRNQYYMRSIYEPVGMVRSEVIDKSKADSGIADHSREGATPEYIEGRIKSLEEDFGSGGDDVGDIYYSSWYALLEGYSHVNKTFDRGLYWWWDRLVADQKAIVTNWDKMTGVKDYYEYKTSLYDNKAYKTKYYHRSKGWMTGFLIDDIMHGNYPKGSLMHGVGEMEKAIKETVEETKRVTKKAMKAIVNVGDPRSWYPHGLLPRTYASDILPTEGFIPWLTSIEKIQVAENYQRQGTTRGIQRIMDFIPSFKWFGLW